MFDNKKNLIFFFIALLFVSLAIVGGVRGYSPVPFWDMWDGYLGFFTKLSDGDWMAWWAQHNEHRILLTRLFFWIDLTIFSGQGWFLIVVNYFLLTVVCYLFWRIWKEIEPDNQNSWIGYFLIAWLFWWIQKNNLEWGFQSQFILAQLLPLLSFYFLHIAFIGGPKKIRFFYLGVLIGILSIGSMANGILTLPLMVVFALMLRMDWRRTLIIGVFSIACIAFYFYEYTAPGSHGNLRQAILTNPIKLLHYVAVYVGSPFSFGSTSLGLLAATVAGIALIASSLFFAWRMLFLRRQNSLQLALLIFILYVGGTALGTAGGRVIFGVEQALSSRYMTPALMAWAALFLLFYINVDLFKSWSRSKLWIVMASLILFMLPQQLKALKSQNLILFDREIAALALELGVKDQEQISNIFPSAEWVLDIVKVPIRENYSIFGMAPLADLREKMGRTFDKKNATQQECKGHLDVVEQIESEPNFLRVRGWLWNDGEKAHDELITFINSDNQISGFALGGQERLDVAQVIDKKAQYSGFKGYILTNQNAKDLFIYSRSLNCRLKVSVPTLLFRVIDHNNFSIQPTVSISSVIGGNQWLGQDFHKTNFVNMQVLGSFINSDADVGSISLKIKRGSRLYYRSGPDQGRQILEIIGSHANSIRLPKSLEWRVLDFSSTELPETFIVKFIDGGDQWGEWSAIGLLK
jgi:hypothetical protein